MSSYFKFPHLIFDAIYYSLPFSIFSEYLITNPIAPSAGCNYWLRWRVFSLLLSDKLDETRVYFSIVFLILCNSSCSESLYENFLTRLQIYFPVSKASFIGLTLLMKSGKDKFRTFPKQ